jgi:hypothetical protein
MPNLVQHGATAAAVALPGTAGVAAKPAPTTVTISASPSLVTFGRYVTVSGTLSDARSGVSVRLQEQPYPYTGGFHDVGGAATTGPGGTYSFTVTPSQSTHYRVQAKASPTATSPEAAVAVRWRVGLRVSDRTPRRGARVRFRGVVKPAHPEGAVLVQRRTRHGWRTVRRTTLRTGTDTRSSYSVRVRIRHGGRYRVEVPGDGAHETGHSRARRLRVHGS